MKHLLMIFLSSPILAFASGPEVITEATAFERKCSKSDGICLTLCYKAAGGWGGTGKCSEEIEKDSEVSRDLVKIKSIFSEDKKTTNNVLQFELREIHRSGRGLLNEFTIEDFREVLERELALRKKRKDADAAAESKRKAQPATKIIDLGGAKQ